MQTPKKWITGGVGGTVAYATKQQAATAHPECRDFIRVDFGLGGLGWLAVKPSHMAETMIAITPDGRELHVVQGYTDRGAVIGFRGDTARNGWESEWQAIMNRVIETGLALATYRQD